MTNNYDQEITKAQKILEQPESKVNEISNLPEQKAQSAKWGSPNNKARQKP